MSTNYLHLTWSYIVVKEWLVRLGWHFNHFLGTKNCSGVGIPVLTCPQAICDPRRLDPWNYIYIYFDYVAEEWDSETSPFHRALISSHTLSWWVRSHSIFYSLTFSDSTLTFQSPSPVIQPYLLSMALATLKGPPITMASLGMKNTLISCIAPMLSLGHSPSPSADFHIYP